MAAFKDQFSKQADIYRNSRPTYPPELYDFITALCKNRNMAWDCATGNGQCAVALAEYFDKVIATDASAQQIQNAFEHPKITYRVATAYNSGLENASADIVTVATAAHWFEIEKFYAEADRVLAPQGVLAIWSYGGCNVNAEVDAVLAKLSLEILADYWAPEIWRIWRDKYKNLPFPYEQITAPPFKSVLNWDLQQLINYLNSWSGVQNYKSKENRNPVALIETELKAAWGDPETTKPVTWHLYMKVGRKP